MAMDLMEQRLRNEVIYLHSLWHQGPPIRPPRNHHVVTPQTHTLPLPLPLQLSQPQFHHYPIQVPIFINSIPTNPTSRKTLLRVSNPTPFKRNSRQRWKKKKDRTFNTRRDGISCDSGKKWPCQESTEKDSHKWLEFDPKKGSHTRPISEEEQVKLAALRMQYRVIDSLHGVFRKNDDGDDDDDEVEEDDDDDGLEESEEYKVFLDVFVKHSALRGYYETNYENGEFCCFVCDVFGIKKSGKKYKSCHGLLQHSVSIMKAKKRRAHRALGMVICKVLGWDIGRLPTIIANGLPLGRSLENSNEVQCNDEQSANVGKEDLKVVEKETVDVVNDENVGSMDGMIVEDDHHRPDGVVLQSSVNEGDACTCGGDIDKGNRDMGMDNIGASNGLTLPKEDGSSSNLDNVNKRKADENTTYLQWTKWPLMLHPLAVLIECLYCRVLKFHQYVVYNGHVKT